MKKTICLCMMVKNESKIIARSLNALKSVIDYWIVVDTGSEDDTIDVIKSTLKDIPGELIERPWVNFGHNRSETIEFARNKCDYILRIDADEEIVIDSFDSSKLTADAYDILYLGNPSYSLPSLLNSKLKWKYIGVTHEYLSCDDPFTKEFLPSIAINHHCDGVRRPDKFDSDISLLREGLKEDPDNGRYMFYLANSLKDIGELKEALDLYSKRSELGGWNQEIWFSFYSMGHCALGLEDTEKAKQYFLEAYKCDPTRAESFYELAKIHRINNEHVYCCDYTRKALTIKIPKDALFISLPVYDYLIKFELSISTYYVGLYEESLSLSNELLLQENVPMELKATILKNKEFSYKKVVENKPKKMKIFIGAHWPAHTERWLANLITYLQNRECFVEYNLDQLSDVDITKKASSFDLVIIWNGEESYYSLIRDMCSKNNIPCYIAEVGYFPQSQYYTLDKKGINATSELIEDNLEWVGKNHLNKLKDIKMKMLGERKRIKGDYVFVPLQLSTDTNIQNNSPFKDMQSFIDHVEEKFEGQKVIIKKHPYDQSSYKVSEDGLCEFVTEGSSLDYILGAKSVYGINSTVLLESVLFGVPVEAIGDGFLKSHSENHQKLLAALVDRQIPINSIDLDYWLDPILKEAEGKLNEKKYNFSADKIEIGGGGQKREGFIQVDIRDLPNVDIQTTCWDIPLPDSTISLIYGRHLFEHLVPSEAKKSLKEWSRLLNEGGRLHLILPDISFHAKQLLQKGNSKYLKGKTNFEHAMAAFYGWEEGPMTHKWGYTKDSLKDLLLKNGFNSVEFKDIRECDIEVIAGKGNVKGSLGGHMNVTNIDEGVLRFFIDNYNIKTMIDIGCGPGGQVELAQKLGLKAIGVDGDKETPFLSSIYQDILIHDFRLEALEKENVDLVWSVEFLEHVDEEYMSNYMQTFKSGSFIVCTASQNTKVPYHVNCKPKDYWIDKFSQYGFKFEPEMTKKIKEVSTMKREFIQETGMVFSKATI